MAAAFMAAHVGRASGQAPAGLVAPMLRCPPEAGTIITSTGKEISLLALVPLHPAEIDLKLTRGTDALLGAFDSIEVSEVFNPARPSAA